eukprot:CAMPEP_0197014108 /NCGR_PEP_ID=MMETSP1380-20130617/68862_1 /TAXON_ID=5936 /ORGANISM="Euplotes crassus, Strain CT5" /LENGTH=86 /DNA_ID=CAMNT_0042438855 /DNA_START=234 /DNA_END=494 /DNA_ORIENTATION=+
MTSSTYSSLLFLANWSSSNKTLKKDFIKVSLDLLAILMVVITPGNKLFSPISEMSSLMLSESLNGTFSPGLSSPTPSLLYDIERSV